MGSWPLGSTYPIPRRLSTRAGRCRAAARRQDGYNNRIGHCAGGGRVELREAEIMYQVEMDHFWFIGKRLALAAFLSRLPERLPGPVLDVGCGTGAVVAALGTRGATVAGLDFLPVCLKLARRRTAAPLTGPRRPPSGRFLGLITCWTCSPTQQGGGPRLAIHRALAPGGYLISRHRLPGLLLPRRRCHRRRFTAGLRYPGAPRLHGGRASYAKPPAPPISPSGRAQALPALPGRSGPLRSDVGPAARALNGPHDPGLCRGGPLAARHDLPFGITVACGPKAA